VTAYLSEAPTTADEVELGLDVMVRVRWAVQADYFARRTVADDLTGIDARRGLGLVEGAAP
jgi:homoserine kinase type II